MQRLERGADLVDEELDGWVQGSVLQRDERHRPLPHGQLYWQDFQCEAIGAEAHHRARENTDKRAGCEEVEPKLHGEGNQADLRRREPARSECIHHNHAVQRVRRWQDPGCIEQSFQVDLAAASPWTLLSCHDEGLIVEYNLDFEILAKVMAAGRPRDAD